MTGTEMDRNDDRLDGFFAAARAAAPEPSAALLARILADAEAAAPRPDAARGAAVRRRGGAMTAFGGWLGALGGWGGLGGLATATVAGLWFGYADPSDDGSFAGVLAGSLGATVTTEILPGGDSVALVAGWEG